MTGLRIETTGPVHPVFVFARLVVEPSPPAPAPTVAGSVLADAVGMGCCWPLVTARGWRGIAGYPGGDSIWWHPEHCPSGVIVP